MQLFVFLISHHRVLTISIERIIIASVISLPFIYSATPEITATTSSTIIIKLLNCATNVCHKEVWGSEVPHKVFCLYFWGHFIQDQILFGRSLVDIENEFLEAV